MADPEPPSLPLILASASPRRRDLLARSGVAFEVRPAAIVERRLPDEAPEACARRLAAEKALSVARGVGSRPPRLVLGADTIVVLDGELLGKPEDVEDAVRMLLALSGRRHRVVTAVAVADSASLTVTVETVTSDVSMRRAGEAELRAYVATGEPLDKAGSYALQGEGGRLIERVEGSETNVIGLPLDETLALVRAVSGTRA